MSVCVLIIINDYQYLHKSRQILVDFLLLLIDIILCHAGHAAAADDFLVTPPIFFNIGGVQHCHMVRQYYMS